jgi:hypothetical protein
MKKKFVMLCIALITLGSSNMQAQGFLKKLGKAVDNATKTLDGNSKSSTKSSMESTTKSTTVKTKSTSVTTASDDVGPKVPDGYKSNLYGGDMDSEADGIAELANYKKSASTKIVTLDGISRIYLGYPSDNRIFVKTPKNGLYCLDNIGNVVKRWERVSELGEFVPRFDSGRFIYSSVIDKHQAIVVCDKDFKTIKTIPRPEAYTCYKNGVAVIYYVVPNGKQLLSPFYRCMYLDVNGNQVFKNLTAAYDNNKESIYISKENCTRPLCDGLAAYCAPQERGYALWGFRDVNGKTVIPAKYKKVHDFRNGVAAVASEVTGVLKWGYIDTKGNEIIPPKFSIEPSDFDSNGLALVFNKDKKAMFINKQGDVASKEYTHSITPFYNGKALLRTDDFNDHTNVWDSDQLIGSDFNVIAHVGKGTHIWGEQRLATSCYPDLDNYANYNESDILFYDNRIYMKLRKDLGYALLDDKGNAVIAGLVGPFVNGLAPAKNKNGVGYVNENGEWVIKFEESNF